MFGIVLVLLPVLILTFGALFVASRYRRCPSNKVLVVFGKVGKGQSSRCIHGGGAFIWPLIQDYAYLNLEPMKINIDLKGAISKENIRVHVPATFMVGVSVDQSIMPNAAERLLGMEESSVARVAEDIIFGQLRDVVATMSIVEINQNRDEFLKKIKNLVDTELHKVGLHIVTVNIRDLDDESGYIKAIGQKAAEEAKQKAFVEVAEQKRMGETGVATKDKERQVTVSEQKAQSDIGVQAAETERRVKTAELDATAVHGEAESKAKIAETNANLKVREAEAAKRGDTAFADAQTAILEAEKKQEIAKLEKEQLAQKEVDRKLAEAEAQAEAAKIKIVAQAKAEAVRIEKEAEAAGIKAVLDAKAMGYKDLCTSLGENAATLLTIEHLPLLVNKQVEAMKSIKIDKLTVLDAPQAGDSSLAHVMRGVVRSIPTYKEMAQNAGVEFPDFFGTVGGTKDQESAQDAGKVKLTKTPKNVN